MKRFAFILLALVGLTGLAHGQCTTSTCTVRPDGWYPSEQYPGEWRFWCHGKTVAGYDPATGTLYQSRDGKMVAVEGTSLTSPTNRNFGLDTSKIGKTERYRINDGTKSWDVTPRRALEALDPPGIPELPDDSGKLRVTVIGTDAERGPALADIAAGPLKDKVVVQDYDPAKPHEQWALRPGFVMTGHPTVYLQKPSGQTLLRTDTYDPEKLIAAVRKADPSYDPKKDPDGKPPVIPGLPDLPLPAWTGLALGTAAVLKKAILK